MYSPFAILLTYRNFLCQKLLRRKVTDTDPDLKFQGGTNRVFGKLRACPLPKRGRFDENGEMTNLHSPTKNKGFAPETPENDENGGCHSGKGVV